MTSTAVTISTAAPTAPTTASTAGERAGASPANGGTPANWPAIVRRSLVLAGILMAMLSMLLGGASAASAVTISAQSGYPGSATLVATHGASTGFASAKITVPWRNVTESTKYANYDQYVCVRPRLFESSGGRWIQSATASNCAWIPADQAAAGANHARPAPRSRVVGVRVSHMRVSVARPGGIRAVSAPLTVFSGRRTLLR